MKLGGSWWAEEVDSVLVFSLSLAVGNLDNDDEGSSDRRDFVGI